MTEDRAAGTDIRSALVLGAGAVGSAVAGIIAARDPRAVAVLAGGERLERCRGQGFLLNGTRRDFRLVSPEEPGHAELVIVAVKNHQLPQAIRDMGGHVSPQTLILPLLNGITSEDELAAAFGREKVLYAMILGIDAVREGNQTVYSSTGKIHFGDAANTSGAWSGRVSRVAAFFERTGVACVVPHDMVRSLWYKFMINVGINQVSAVIRAPYRVFQTDPEAKAVMEAAMAETVALSKAMGTGLADSDITAWHKTLSGFGPEGKTSMLQDVEARRKTEVEAFADTVMSLGRKAGVPTPVNATLSRLLHAIEKTYSG
jgi:2-dehydropantoate 2-reductase